MPLLCVTHAHARTHVRALSLLLSPSLARGFRHSHLRPLFSRFAGRTGDPAGEKVSTTIFKDLFTLYPDVLDVVDFKVVPFGFAEWNGTSWSCMHGPSECRTMAIEVRGRSDRRYCTDTRSLARSRTHARATFRRTPPRAPSATSVGVCGAWERRRRGGGERRGGAPFVERRRESEIHRDRTATSIHPI